MSLGCIIIKVRTRARARICLICHSRFVFERSRVQMSVRGADILTQVLRGFLSPFRRMPGHYFKLGHIRFLPYLLQFVIR
jgi:hypothetical protein